MAWDNDWQDLDGIGKILDEDCEDSETWKENKRTREIWIPSVRDAWIERFLKIRTKKTGEAAFVLNRAQREYSRRCSKQNIVLKARQLGMTTYVAARFFAQTIMRKGVLSVQVAHSREAAEEIFRIVRRFYDHLDGSWRKGRLKTSHRNVHELVFPEIDSEFAVTSAEENAGRGRTIHYLHCTEVSRWGSGGEEALASLRAALVPEGEIVLESTPNGAGGLFYEEWQRAGETGYTTHFFPWWFEDAYVSEPGPSFQLTEEEMELAEIHGLRTDQLAWRRRQWAALRRLAVQEFAEDPVSCFRAAGECVFELEAVDEAFLAAGDPLESRDNGRLLIWFPSGPHRRYVIGVDPAGGGIDGDFSCAQVIDRETGMQCAELHGHYPPKELAEELVRLGRMYNTAPLAVERNNHGGSVLACLDHLDYPNVYRHDGQAGWPTTAQTRPRMIEGLGWALIEATKCFRSARLLHEFRTFVRFKDGGTGAAPGTHDDCVLAMAIAWAVREEDMAKGLGGSKN